MLLNLQSNAIKFTEKGEVKISVTLEGESILFMVEDTGIGIKKAD
jgi:signal transduction histidine kinase